MPIVMGIFFRLCLFTPVMVVMRGNFPLSEASEIAISFTQTLTCALTRRVFDRGATPVCMANGNTMRKYAFATLLTSDSYLQGALTLVAALRDVHPSPAVSPEVEFETVCIVTPETVDVSTVKVLRKAFDVVVGVEVITQPDDRNLQLLGEPFFHALVNCFSFPERWLILRRVHLRA